MTAVTVVGAVGASAAPSAAASVPGAVPPGPAAAERVLYSFGGTDGAGPQSGVTEGPGGVLYGTTVFGGKDGDGTVFTLTPDGSGGYTEKVDVSFHGRYGSKPGGNVVANSQGDLFGDTVVGGGHGAGAVFELVPSGSGYAEKVLYAFTGGLDGNQPIGTPVLNAQGDIFGVTQFGGAGGQGVIFEVKPTKTGYAERVLHSFGRNGGQPQAGLAQASDGTLYGTLYGESTVHEAGTVFSLRPTQAGWVYTGLYYFHGSTDGKNPYAALTVDNKTGVIYGSTQYGGGSGSYGTVFSLTPGAHGYTERVLHSFTSDRGGLEPGAPLLLTAGGDLYSTTMLAGTGCHGIGCSTVYELVPAGSGAYTFRLIYQFTGPPDGADPEGAGLTAGPGGVLFGTTNSGGAATSCSDGGPGGVAGCGTVYEITP